MSRAVPSRTVHRVVLVSALCLASLRAEAQTDATTAAARAAFERGMAEAQGTRYAQAAAAFEESYRLRPVPVVLYNLAGAYAQDRQLGRAIATYERYLREGGDTLPAERVAFVRDTLTRLRGQRATVRLDVRPTPDAVRVDGQPVQAEGGAVQVDPGERTVEVSAPGHAAAQRTLTLLAGDAFTLRLTLTPTASAARVGTRGAGPRAATAAGPVDARVALSPGADEGITRQWWFWPGVGVAAVGVTLGVLAASGVFDRLAPPPEGLDYIVNALTNR